MSLRPKPEGLLVTAIVTALVAFGAISTDLYLPSLPAIAAHFEADAGAVQLTLSVFLVGFAVSQLVHGPLSDRFGRKPVLICALALYLVSSLACALAETLTLLIVARFLQAVGACAGVVLGRAIVRDVHGRERAAKVLSYVASAMALAPVLGPILGGYIEAWLGWRANFGALVGFGTLTLLAVVFLLPETNLWRDPRATDLGRSLANYRALAVDPLYRGYVLISSFAYGGIFAFISGSSFLLIDVLGLPPERYGLCFAAVVVGYMIGSFASGRLTLRFGLERMVALGALIVLVAGLLSGGLTLFGHLSVAGLVGPVFLFLLGAGLVLPNAVAGAIGPFPDRAGAASALLGFVQMTLAALLGIAVGLLHDETGRGMTLAIAFVGLGAALTLPLLAAARRRAAIPDLDKAGTAP